MPRVRVCVWWARARARAAPLQPVGRCWSLSREFAASSIALRAQFGFTHGGPVSVYAEDAALLCIERRG
eukprot:11218001-Lingulodinium_polyedra.AAC.1